MIEFRNALKRYADGKVAVDDLSFTAPTGEITVLIGPSGSSMALSVSHSSPARW